MIVTAPAFRARAANSAWTASLILEKSAATKRWKYLLADLNDRSSSSFGTSRITGSREGPRRDAESGST